MFSLIQFVFPWPKVFLFFHKSHMPLATAASPSCMFPLPWPAQARPGLMNRFRKEKHFPTSHHKHKVSLYRITETSQRNGNEEGPHSGLLKERGKVDSLEISLEGPVFVVQHGGPFVVTAWPWSWLVRLDENSFWSLHGCFTHRNSALFHQYPETSEQTRKIRG